MAHRQYFLSTVTYCNVYNFPPPPPHWVDAVIYGNKISYFHIVDLCIRMYLHYFYLEYLFLNIFFSHTSFLLIQFVTFR